MSNSQESRIENSPHTMWSFVELPDLDGGLCDLRNEVDPEMWFLEDPVIQREAKRYCRACPVRQACLESAYEEERQTGYYAFGIRGAKTAEERQVVLNRMRARDGK